MEETIQKTDDISFPEIIHEMSKIIRKNHIDYNQMKYIFRKVRQECDLKPLKKNQGAKEHLSQEEAQLLINHAYGLKGSTGLMLKVLLFTGARVNEFVNIRMQDVYMNELKIYLATTKGDKPRYVPIFNLYAHELKLYLDNENRTKGYLFESNRHNQYSTRRIEQIIKKLCKDIGIKKRITPHRLRATIATWLSEKGMPTEQIQQFLGHSKLETTQIYTKAAVHQLGETANRLLL